jgi:hypothetical protein
MKLAKSRIRGYYRRSERLSGLIGLASTMVLCLWLRVIGVGITLNDQKIESKAYAKPIVMVEPKYPEMTEKQQIMSYIVEVFGDDADDAITIINKCENSEFNPKATNHNSNGTWDTGIFQINQVHGYSLEEMQDWHKNIDVAKKIFDNRGWKAWSCSHVIGVKSFWQ